MSSFINIYITLVSIESRDDALNHMGTRRHLMPAIYNANLERYHWTPPNAADEAAVKLETEGLIWIRDITIDLLDADSEDENELIANGKKKINIFFDEIRCEITYELMYSI